MTGIFVLSVDTEDPIEARSGNARWDASDRRGDARREAIRRFMRLLDGHAMSATWVVGEGTILNAWGRRKSDGFPDPSESLVGAVAAMATGQEIAVSPSPASAAGAGDGARDGDARLDRCARFAERNECPLRTLALPADAAVDVERYAALGFTACRRTPLATRPTPLTDDLFQRPVPSWRPSDLERAGPILMVPVSVRIGDGDNRRRLVPEAARIARIRKALDLAASEGALIHVAFRLVDLAQSEILFRTIEDILFHVAETRAGGGLRVATIAELRLAHDAEAGTATPLRAA